MRHHINMPNGTTMCNAIRVFGLIGQQWSYTEFVAVPICTTCMFLCIHEIYVKHFPPTASSPIVHSAIVSRTFCKFLSAHALCARMHSQNWRYCSTAT